MKQLLSAINPLPSLLILLFRKVSVSRALLLAFTGLLTMLFSGLLQNPLNMLEEHGSAIAWQLDPDTTLEERINIIAIDEKSINALGAWPWPRATMARLSDALSKAGVQQQLFDIWFSESREGDEQLLQALSAAPALLGQVPAINGAGSLRTGVLTHSVSGIDCGIGSAASSALSGAEGFIGNIPLFASVPKGHIAPIRDDDGGIRRIPALVCVDGAAYPALAISALLLASGSSWQLELQPGSSFMGPAQVLKFKDYPGLDIPLDAAGNMLVSYSKAPDSFRAIPAVDVIEGRIDPDMLRNSWALVGYAALGLNDTVPTPFNGAAYGVEIQARILASVLDNNIPYSPNSANLLLAMLCLLSAAVLFVLASLKDKTAMAGLTLCSVILPLLFLGLHVALLQNWNISLGWTAPAMFSLMASALLVLHEYVRVRLERSRVLQNLNSYLPSGLAREIAYSMPNSEISARRQNITLLNADLRNFSAYTEARPPEETAAILHFFFTRATEIIEQSGGQVYEFKGDGLLALWDGADAAAANEALQAAKQLQSNIDELMSEYEYSAHRELEPLALGIGLEQGPVLLGSIGSSHRRSAVLLGETVTIVLRIQMMTAELAQPILLGECIARQLQDSGLSSQGSYLLDGLQTPHTLFAPEFSERAIKSDKKAEPVLKVLRGGRS